MARKLFLEAIDLPADERWGFIQSGCGGNSEDSRDREDESGDAPEGQFPPQTAAIDDLGIDSLDFLDIVFALDKKFGIKIPLEQWTQEVNEGKASVEDYFVVKNLCARIDELVAAKQA